MIELPIPNIPYRDSVDKSQLRVLEGLQELGGKTVNSMLRETLQISPQRLSYHLKELEKKDLVKLVSGHSAQVTSHDGRVLLDRVDQCGQARIELAVSRYEE